MLGRIRFTVYAARKKQSGFFPSHNNVEVFRRGDRCKGDFYHEADRFLIYRTLHTNSPFAGRDGRGGGWRGFWRRGDFGSLRPYAFASYILFFWGWGVRSRKSIMYRGPPPGKFFDGF